MLKASFGCHEDCGLCFSEGHADHNSKAANLLSKLGPTSRFSISPVSFRCRRGITQADSPQPSRERSKLVTLSKIRSNPGLEKSGSDSISLCPWIKR